MFIYGSFFIDPLITIKTYKYLSSQAMLWNVMDSYLVSKKTWSDDPNIIATLIKTLDYLLAENYSIVGQIEFLTKKNVIIITADGSNYTQSIEN